MRITRVIHVSFKTCGDVEEAINAILATHNITEIRYTDGPDNRYHAALIIPEPDHSTT